MNVEDANVLIGMPNYTNLMSSEVYANHIACVSHWERIGLKFKFLVVGRTFVHFARTQICQVAADSQEKEQPYTHVFWLDDDAIIHPETLPAFIRHDKDVVISPYPMRRSPYQIGVLSATAYICKSCDHQWQIGNDITPRDTMMCPECGGEGLRDFHNMPSYRNLKIADMDQGLITIDGGGTHAQLWKYDVLERAGQSDRPIAPALQKMMDEMTEEERKVLDHNVGELPDPTLSFKEEDDMGKSYFTMPKVGTEDMLWCYRARCKGIEIHCDTDVFADHVGFVPVITKEFTKAAEQKARDKVTAGVHLMDVDTGRDHTSIEQGTAASLV
jgi:hypothetical protein